MNLIKRGTSSFEEVPVVTTVGSPGADTNIPSEQAVREALSALTMGRSFWTNMPGSPTRASDTSCTLTDTGNANKYDLLFCKGTLLRWMESSTEQFAMVTAASYASNTVTLTLTGDSLTTGFTSMKYCLMKAIRLKMPPMVGTLAIGDNLSATYEYAQNDFYKFYVDVYVGAAGSTNATTGHVNDDGSSIQGSDWSISSGSTSASVACSNPTTAIAAGSKFGIDITAVSTTPPTDLYAYVWVMPVSWRYEP